MKNVNECSLQSLNSDELQHIDGGGIDWKEFLVRLLISEFDDIHKGAQDAAAGRGYNYK